MPLARVPFGDFPATPSSEFILLTHAPSFCSSIHCKTMTRTQQTSQASNRVKKARRSSAQDSRRQPTGFITWTDWRAFQPTRPSSSNKSSDDESPKYSHTDGWHPDAFADRYRRSSYPKLSPLPVKNLNILNSQRITTWERDFFSSLLVPDQGPGQHIKSEPEISQ